MLDLAIRNGLLIDGSGLPAFRGDLGIAGGRIVSVGPALASAARTIDASGLAVAPGFVDPHTHFDAQLCWDPQARPSLEHGVTTIVPGNCSLSLAPLRKDQRGRLSRMFRQIEEMPEAAFDDGIDWRWGESFEGMLEALAPNLAINVAPLVGHSSIRLFVMGEDAAQRTATADEVRAMQDVLRGCLEAGAVGLSTSFIDIDENLRPVPSRFAHKSELAALCAVLGERGRILQAVHEFFDTELTLSRVDQLAELSLQYGIATTFSPLFQNRVQPEMGERVLARVEEQWRRGARVWPQVQTRPIDISFTLAQRSLLFITMPSWYLTVSLPTLAAKLAAFGDPATKQRLIAEATLPAEIAAAAGRDWENTIVRKVAHERNRGLEGRRLGEIAAEQGKTPLEVMIDLSVEEGLETWFLRSRIGHSDDARVGAMLAHPFVHVGAGDGGAHVASFATYGDTGYLFSRFVRETKALRIEEAVKKISFDPCSIWGLAGRGLLRTDHAADVVVFDPATIDRGPEIEARDLPGDGIRWVRHAQGVHTVLVNGAVAWSAAGGYTDSRTGTIATRRGDGPLR
jgi:N-acyl-D-aspartate/D-glutamate deacylase